MAIKVMNLVWSNAACKSNTLLTLLALADWANEDGVAWPAVNTLAKKTRQSERNTQYALRKLEEMKLIEPLNTATKTISYRINVALLDGVQSLQSDRGAKIDKTGVQKSTKASAEIAPNTKTKSIRKKDTSASQEKSLHERIRTYIQKKHLALFRIKCQWDASEGKILESTLNANPSWTAEQWRSMIDNRFASELITPERPRIWLPNVGKYIAGPLDKFGRLRTPVVAPVSSESERPSLLDKVREQLNGGKK